MQNDWTTSDLFLTPVYGHWKVQYKFTSLTDTLQPWQVLRDQVITVVYVCKQ